MRELHISKFNLSAFYRALFTIALFFAFGFSAFSQCPTIQIVDLRGTPGFPQTDDLNVCGAPDTLSLLMFTDAPGQIKGFEFTVNMETGMRYAGFEEAHYGGCTSLTNSDPDINSPSFIGGGITCGDIFVANIGVTADCSVDLEVNDYLLEVEYSYTYFPPTGGSIKCKGSEILDNDFNGAMKESVLNMTSPVDLDATVTSLGAPACQTFRISQDGLQAYLDEFQFAVCGVDIGAGSPISISTMTANGIDLLGDAIYNPADTSLTATIDASFFPSNSSTNPLGTPEQFDTDERVNFEICYEVANCLEGADIPFSYKAWYGCFDEVCQQTGQSSFLKVRPTGSELPDITATLLNGITICGDDAEVSVTVTNPNTDTDQNVYTDLSIGFQACGMEAFDITEVIINGENVPPVYMVIADDIDIDLSMNTNANIGLLDYDGDGFLDDLPGESDPLIITVKFSLACGVGADGGCPEINCDNVQFYLEGKTNCGNNFQGFPQTGGFDLQYGQEDVGNIDEVDLNNSGSVVGYDFGKYSNDGVPLTGTGPKDITVEFCYEFAQENVVDCPSGGETFMRTKISGQSFMTNDIDFVPGTVMFDDGSGYVLVDDSDVTLTTPMDGMAILQINVGNNNPNLCYKYTLEMDECYCGPIQYMSVDQQIISVCSDCDPDCEIVKGCRTTLFKADPECSPCSCVAEYFPTRTERKNLGYVDKEMSRKITRDELLLANALDLNRFMPGDTLWHQGYWELYDGDFLFTDPMRWFFFFHASTLSGAGTSGNIQAAIPLTWDGGDMKLNELKIENTDGTTYTVNINELAGCAAGGSGDWLNSFDTHFKTDWGDHPGDEYESTYDCAYDAWEGFNHEYTAFDMWNYDRMEEINAENPDIAERYHFAKGDCLSEFIEAYGIGVGTKIHFDWCVPLIKNPLREQAMILGLDIPEQSVVRIIPGFHAYESDVIAGSETYGMGAVELGCSEMPTYNVSCPGGLKSETNIILDNCGGTVVHEFVVDAFAGPPGDEWFTHEYRPIVEINDLELPIYSPLAYCANAQVDQNGVVTPVVVDSVMNMTCSPVAGYSDNICAVDEGNLGAIVIDLKEQGFRGLGIGLDNCDTLRLSYDVCMICPAPLEGLLDYELKADWCYQGGQPSDCSIEAMTYYFTGSANESHTLVDEAVAGGFSAAHNVNYYDLFNLDTLYCKIDDTEGVVFIDDEDVVPGIPLSATNSDGSDLIASESAGESIEVKEIEFCNNDPNDATGFVGYVTIPNPVMFQGACLDAAGTTSLTTALISDDGQVKKYQIEFPADVLPSGNCQSVFIKTTLLYCPLPVSLPPEICVGASSGCSPVEVRSALGGGGNCSSSEVCYAYLFGEADLQTEWFSMPDDPALCETFTLHVRTKNVKDLVLLNLDPKFTLPFGLSVVPGSWEVAYPGGSVEMMGNFGTWEGVPDPDVVSGFDYSWSDDAVWSTFIDVNGLPGVSTPVEDGNKVAFRFQVTTNCEEFLSGSKPRTETLATDPCGPGDLSSGDVESPPIVIDGADPADFAQILAIGSPSELYCGGLDNIFGLTALNISEVPTTDSVVTCITIPGDVMTYTPGSIRFTNGFTPDWVTETMFGNDIQVCVHSPILPAGEAWSIEFEAVMNEDAPCGEIEIPADIKSVVDAVSCVPGPPDECAVFVQNSLNPVILVDLKPPLQTDDIRVSADCSASEDPVQICYDIDLSNPGPQYDGNVRVGIHDDVTANGVLDSFDGELNGADHAVSLAHGETVTLSMCLDVDAIQSCPIIIKQTYETDCACDSEETPFMNVSPSWFAELPNDLVLCPGQPLELMTCGDYELSFDPEAGVSVTDDGMGLVTLEINDGFGVGTPVIMNLTGSTGECEVMDAKSLHSLGDWVPEDLEANICENDCVDLDLLIPSDLVDGATITWTPELGLDDPTSDTPELCDLTASQTYNVEISFGLGCSFNIEYDVFYSGNGFTTIEGEEFCLCYEAGTLSSPIGFSTYEWYSIQSGAEILEAVTTTNTWNGPTEAGEYFVKATLGGALCPHVSESIILEGKECVDLELDKEITNIPDPLVLGSQVTYQLTVCNIEDEDLGLKFDATNVEVSDELPGAVTYVQHSQTSGNYSPTTNQWDISIIEIGTCDTLYIDVTIDEPGTIENTAQVSGADNEDIDSTPNNDDGDQSEDEEDAAIIELACESISGEIFYDLDDNGCEDGAESLVMEPINISLYECGDMPGTDAPQAVTTVTDGDYEFGPESTDPSANICLLPNVEYFVVFDIPNSEGESLEDYTFSSGNADMTCNMAGESDDVDPASGQSGCHNPTDDDMDDGDADNNIDAGITPPCYELAGEIFYDNNDDGCQDPGETLVMEAIEVSLYECGDVPGVDQPQASTIVTDGEYEFGLDSDDPGADFCLENNTEYFVVFDIPNASGEALEDYEFSNGEASGACAVAGESDNVDPATGASGCYDPDNDDSGDGDDDQNIDAGITPPCHEIAGEIFYDMNDNGCEDGGETLVMEPITVTLFPCGADLTDPSQAVASTTVTDGDYMFGEDSTDPGANVCLESNVTYQVVFEIPNGVGETLEGYEFSSMDASTACEAGGESDDVDPTTGASGCYNPDNDDPTDGSSDENIDAGIIPPCHQLAGEIFYDGNNDGCQDMSEGLVMEDIEVTLYECGDTPGIDPPVASTTVSDGVYEFGEDSMDPGANVCLEAGTEYFVVFDIPNDSGEALDGYEFSTGTASGSCQIDGQSDDVDPSNGQSGCYDPDNADGGDSDADQNIDAGITPPCEQIAGEIFYDNNNNGCEDPGETLVMEAINVSLFPCGADLSDPTQAVASTTVSDGMYTFGENSDDPGADICLEAGTSYTVIFDIPNAIGQALEEHEISTGTADAACEAGGESNDVDPATSATDCVDPSNSDGSDGDDDENLDLGIVPPCENIAGEIFYDGNDNGCQDMGEMLVDLPVEVSLYECGDIPGVDQPVASTTVSDGMYEFSDDSTDPGADICLEAGTEYFVAFDLPNGLGEALEGYEFSSMNASGACAASGESDNVDPTDGTSSCHDPNDDDMGDGDDDNNIDAGIVPPCEQLAGEIFYDGNENGCQDSGEMLVMESVSVSLFPCGADLTDPTQAIASTTVTDGMYVFGENSDDPDANVCLEAGTTYQVVFDIPNGIGEDLEEYEFTTGTASSGCEAAGESDDVDASTGASACYDPDNDDGSDGDSDENIDAGITPPCEQIAGEIFYDTNDNGCEDIGESLVMEAINVLLFECGDDPLADTPVASTTVTDGDYTFGENSMDPGADICLEAGTEYFVVFDIPNGPGEALADHEFSSGATNTTCAASGESDDVNPNTGATGCVDPNNDDASDGDDDENLDAGIVPPCYEVAGEIFYDNNNNGCQDSGESLVTEGITVSLFTCDSDPAVDPPAAVTMVLDGQYEFGELSDDPGADICLTPATEYFVVFSLPNANGEVLQDYTFSTGMASAACEGAGESDDVNPMNGATDCVNPANDDGDDGDDDQNLDAGIVPACESMGGEIFYDYDDNGCQDMGEPLVMDAINVSLYECGDNPAVGQPIASTTVNDGMYEFGEGSDDPGADICLEAGTEYFVVFDIPNAIGEALEDHEFSSNTASGACALSGDSDNVDPSNGASACHDPSDSDSGDGDDDNNIDAGIVPPCESLAGEIFYDDNSNGCQDTGEQLVTEIVNVSLFACNADPSVDTPIASTSTNDGMYDFGLDSDDPGADVCLQPGTEYFVVFDIPNDVGEALDGYEFTSGTADAGCESLGESDDVDPANGQSDCYDPNDDDATDGGDDENIDAGITPPCESLAGEIFYDNNGDGCQDGSETLVMENIDVTLYECGDTPGVDQPVASTTVSDGMYEFGPDSDDPGAQECLEAGTEYFVVFDIPNGPGEALEFFDFTDGVASGACATSGDSDNVDPRTGESSCVDPDDDDTEDGDDDENVDAGIQPMCESLAGEIFYDDNANGCQDGAETLVDEAVDVTLYECGDIPGVDQPVASTTVADGEYEFGPGSDDPNADICLEAGTEYFVVFDIPNGPGEALEFFDFTEGVASGTCANSGDSDNVDPSTGESGCVDPDDDDSADGDDDQNVDAGITPMCESLAGEIFYDTNENGCQDPTESLVMFDVEVSLYECGDTPGVDQPLASTTVNNGEYEFGPGSDDLGADICLEAGTEYFVAFDIPNGAGEDLDGYDFTEGVASGVCAVGGDSDNVDPATGTSGCYDPDDNDSGDGDDDQDIDAGITPPCESVAGEIFYDGNENGCQDGNEGLVMEVINVTLYECNAIPGTDAPVASTSVTDGMYMFGMGSDDPGADICLDANTTYFVVFDIPMGTGQVLDGYEFTEGVAGVGCMTAGMSDDVDPNTGMSDCYDPTNNDGDSDENIDAGIKPPCEQIAGEIFYDDNNNGCQDPNEPLVDDQAIEVVLYQCGDTPGLDQPAAFTTVTDGMYLFGQASDDPGADICLEAGEEYFVEFHIPNGPGEALEDYYFSENIAAPSCLFSGEGDNIDPTTGQSGCHDPSNTDDGDQDADENIDAGIMHPCEEMAGEIFYDDNNDGCQDAGESLVTEDVMVTLYQCDPASGLTTPVASTTTNTGQYQFGDYSLDSTDDPCLNPRLEYFVAFEFDNGLGAALENYYFSDGDGGACAATGDDDDTDPYSGETDCYDPDELDDDMNIDAGITPCEEIAGEVFYDWNADGCHDPATEAGAEGVDVYIFSCSEGSPDPSNALASTSTDANGEYAFGPEETGTAEVCLHPDSTYFVMFEVPNANGEIHDDFYLTDGDSSECAGGDSSDDVDPETGLSDCTDPENDDSDDGDNDENVDAGITPCEEIAGEVFYDWNGDGCQDDATEGPVVGVEVSIYSCSETDPNPSNALATDVTDVDGEYTFGPEETDGGHICLHPDSSYYVVFDIPNATGESLDDFSLTEGDGMACVGGDSADDVDPETGQSDCHDPSNDDAGDGGDDENIDAGIIPCEELAGEVYFDWNQNGCQDGTNETGAEGVDVYIYECSETNPTPGNALASTTTNADGEYTFGPGEEGDADICLSENKEYFVLFDIPNGPGEAYEGFNFTEGDGSSCVGDGTADDVDAGTGTSDCYDPSDNDGDDDQDVDAGIEGCLDLGGTVYYDLDGNGCQDPATEGGAPFVRAYLYNCDETDPTPENALATDITTTMGDYLFGPAEPGQANYCLSMDSTYYVVFDIPNAPGQYLEGYNFTEGDGSACANDDSADDVDSSTGQSDCYDPMDDGTGDDGDNDVDAGIAIYDLALTKIIKPTDPVQVGDDICFTIEVFNQGTLPAYEVLVNDYVPSGLLLSANDGNGWNSISASHAVATIPGPIMPMTSTTIDIVMTVQEGATLATMMNVAEIGSFQDVNGNDVTNQDVDSDGDNNPDNDGDMTDNDTDGTDGDEDDSDPAWPPVFDLSLIKYTDHDGPVVPGDVITFYIEVCNQGNIAAQNIVIYDYPNTGLELSSSDTNGWAADANGLISMTYTDILAPGKCEIVEVDMEILPGATSGNVNNVAEIGASQDENGNDMSDSDVDSTSDSDDSNDEVMMDDDHNSTGGDEDDHDPEGLEVFDLALRKLIQQPGPYQLNDVVRFDIEVCNQGDITAANVMVSDYIPAGLSFVNAPANSAWDKVSNSLATTTYEPNIQPGQCVTIPIFLQLISVDPAALVNMAEISGATDDEGTDMSNADVDSHADGDNTNDIGNDPYSDLNDLNNQNSYLGGDEDDHDQAWVLVCSELACQGNLNVSLDQNCSVMVTAEMILSPALYPSDMYEIEITDQYGNVVDNLFDATDIGNSFDVSISLPLCNNNSCWGSMTIEDKFPPVLDCNPGPFYVPCNGIDQIPAPTATENCSDYTIMLIDEVEEVFQCEGFTGKVTRTYVGVDAAGNESAVPCVQEIYITRPDLSNITPPETATYSCSEDFVADANGYPAPWISPLTGSGSGVPILCVEEVCGVTIEAMDQFGDGWNGAELDVVIGGVVAQTITLENGESFTKAFPVSEGTTVDFVWTDLGTFPGEIGFTVTDSYGDDIAVVGPGGQTIGTAFSYVQDCPGDGINTGVSCMTGSGTPMNGIYLIPGPQAQVCNTFVSYEDTALPQIGCTQKIMRRFEVREWWCGGELQWAGTQLIEITDDEGPVMTCPDNFTVTTDQGCDGEVILPVINPVDGCGAETHVNVQIEGSGVLGDEDYYPGAFLETNGGAVTLPVGQNIVTYIAYDACYNSSTCSMVVTVMDNTQPVAICESNTVVSLPSDGNIEVWAQTFDDGSFDECGLATYEVTRMASTCDPADVTEWDDVVSFCCADVGTEVMVALRVTDASGNSNICMTTVTVQDKTIPSITCPADMTITCVEPYDLDNLTPFFGAPTVVDNCMVEDFAEDMTADINSCGTGTITRDFTIEDVNGVVVASCQQVITVVIDDPMVESDIIWPANQDLYDVCDLAGTHPDILGYPIITEGVCDLVGFNYEDEVFENVPGSQACAKILRTWQVVNWCQEDANGDVQIWPENQPYTQVIVLYNTVDPVITNACEKVVVTSGDADCGDVFVPLVNTATDDCTPEGLLSWTWTIDVNLDGDPSNDISGTGNDASGVYPLGEHLISWTVQDLCGNVDFCDQQISITNTKTPNAVCIYGLSAELIPMDLDLDGTADTEMVTLWAEDFDAESAHPCGYDVTVSFSADVNDTFVTFGCGQVGVQTIELWVTASNGTTSICETFVNITNNADEGLCTPLTDMVEVEGRISTESNKEVENVHVNLEGSNLSDMTDDLGEYAFANMPMGGAYKVKPRKNDDLLNGVTTLDIIHIQRHILALAELQTPYQFIAADVNNNGSISGLDLIEIRKAILGVKNNFTNNESWRFIDAEFTFNANEDPLEQLFDEDYNIPVLSDDMHVDFTAVKIGDVNGSVVTNGFAADDLESRSSNVFELKGSMDDNKLTISSDQAIVLRGMQMTVELNTDASKVVGIESLGIEFTSDSYNIDNDNGFMTMSWNTNELRKFEAGEALFALVLESDIDPKSIEVSSSVTKAEAYNSDFEILDIAYNGGEFIPEVALYQNEPNPWVSKTTIRYSIDMDQEVVFYFRNAEGKLLKKVTTKASAGMNMLPLDATELNAGTGVIYYEMHTQTDRIMKKMILVH